MGKEQFSTSPEDQDILWFAFERYAGEEGISLDHRDDWVAWWLCFKAGAEAQDQEWQAINTRRKK
jgi:hypothetical protein